MQVPSLGWEDPLEEGMATHSGILVWEIPWTEQPGGLTVHRVTQSWTRLKRLSTHRHGGCPQAWVTRHLCLGPPQGHCTLLSAGSYLIFQENDQQRDFPSHFEDEGSKVQRLRGWAPYVVHASGADVSSPSENLTMAGYIECPKDAHILIARACERWGHLCRWG